MRACLFATKSPSRTELMVSCQLEHQSVILLLFTLLLPVASTRITPELQRYVQKLINSFGVSLEQGTVAGALSQETLTKRAQVAAQDPAFQRLKAQFSSDFELRCVVRVFHLLF